MLNKFKMETVINFKRSPNSKLMRTEGRHKPFYIVSFNIPIYVKYMKMKKYILKAR